MVKTDRGYSVFPFEYFRLGKEFPGFFRKFIKYKRVYLGSKVFKTSQTPKFYFETFNLYYL